MFIPLTSARRPQKHLSDTEHMPPPPYSSQAGRHDTIHKEARYHRQLRTGYTQTGHCGLKTCADQFCACDLGVTTQRRAELKGWAPLPLASNLLFT